MDVTIRPATHEDMVAWYGNEWKRTVRAWVAEVDGAVAALAGYSFEKEFTYAFSHIKDGVSLPRRVIYRGAVLMFEEMKRRGVPLVAIANPEIQNSGKLLQRLGFRMVGTGEEGDIYVWNS